MSAARKGRRKDKGKARSKGRGKGRSRARLVALSALGALLAVYAVFAVAAVRYVHHPRAWIAAREASWPRILTAPLAWVGYGISDVTDGLGLTGYDVVYEYDREPPSGEVLFAGAPRRVGNVQPDDIVVLDRGEFVVGWSPSLRRPVWCAYHVASEASHPTGKRPNFTKDREAANSPAPADYGRSGYDRGHMVPNHAIESRYGAEAQRKTFLMSNIAPQSAALNRGVWRNVERRIADFWAARYGEVWVVVGTVPGKSRETVSGTDIDVPERYFQVVVAQEGQDVRALALVYGQDVPWGEWAVRGIVTIDELEELSGLDFLPELDQFIQTPLESGRPTRLWPVRFADVFRLFLLRFD